MYYVFIRCHRFFFIFFSSRIYAPFYNYFVFSTTAAYYPRPGPLVELTTTAPAVKLPKVTCSRTYTSLRRGGSTNITIITVSSTALIIIGPVPIVLSARRSNTAAIKPTHNESPAGWKCNLGTRKSYTALKPGYDSTGITQVFLV